MQHEKCWDSSWTQILTYLLAMAAAGKQRKKYMEDYEMLKYSTELA